MKTTMALKVSKCEVEMSPELKKSLAEFKKELREKKKAEASAAVAPKPKEKKPKKNRVRDVAP